MKNLLISAALLTVTGLTASAQTASQPVSMVITAEPLRGSQTQALSVSDVTAWQGDLRLPVTELIPLQGKNAAMDFYILIDERIDPDRAVLFERLREFIGRQAPETAVGVAYMFNGEARIVRSPTRDHALAAEALRATSGSESAAASPYTSLSQLVNGWKADGAMRHEVLMVTDGMDRFETFGDYNMYVDDAVNDAQRAGVIVYTMYEPCLGHASHSPALIRWGQTYLGQIAEETGGEAYLPNSNSATSPAQTSLDTYLADLTKHLANQYRIGFLATPLSGEEYQRVSFEARGNDVELIGARRFYLKAQQPTGVSGGASSIDSGQ